jgi:metal-dependent hydrolase (beta-lactamase superfamily II)
VIIIKGALKTVIYHFVIKKILFSYNINHASLEWMEVYADKGLVVILGCAHSGMINILNRLINKTGKDKFYAILSGTHLDFLAPEQLEESIKALKKMGIERMGAPHCTGRE